MNPIEAAFKLAELRRNQQAVKRAIRELRVNKLIERNESREPDDVSKLTTKPSFRTHKDKKT